MELGSTLPVHMDIRTECGSVFVRRTEGQRSRLAHANWNRAANKFVHE